MKFISFVCVIILLFSLLFCFFKLFALENTDIKSDVSEDGSYQSNTYEESFDTIVPRPVETHNVVPL